MTHLMPFFMFVAVIAIILVVAAIVRPKLPYIFQHLFTGAVMIVCLVIFLEMGISAIFTALKGAFQIAFNFYG